MCGICGIFQPTTSLESSKHLVRVMAETLAHRGPDGEGIWSAGQGQVVLGHKRLAIIDLSSGQQPMHDPVNGNVIVFNGEIYNYRELRKELESSGCAFRTSSDTEVLLVAYREWGIDALARLNGIFAFALYDAGSAILILARDRFGVKPLYYSVSGQSLSFASEIKALLKNPEVSRDLDMDAIATYLQLRYNPSPQTMLRSVRKLIPGHVLVASQGGHVREMSYVRGEVRTRRPASEDQAVEEYQALLDAAVRRQMISDVPVGLLLSGGIDSAIVGKLMTSTAGYRVQSFTVGFPGDGDFNELLDARRTAGLIGTEHHEILITEQEYTDFFLRSFSVTEEPLAEPTIPALYTVCKLASSQVKVVLSGQGADEPLGGYRKYLAEHFFGSYPLVGRMLPLRFLAALRPRSEVLSRAAYAASFPDELGRFLGISSIFTDHEIESLVPGATSFLSSGRFPERLKELHEASRGLSDSLSRLLYIDTRSYLSDDLLIFGDKMSMAHSLELRVPFLDNDLVDFVESLPGRYKIRRWQRKYIHKTALAHTLPQEIIRRKKKGFLTPVSTWLRGGMGVLAKDIFTSTDVICGGGVDRKSVLCLLDAHQKGTADNGKRLFALLSLQLWYKEFLCGQTDRNRLW